jgi:TolB-like protein
MLCWVPTPAGAQDIDQSIQDLAKQLYQRMAATQVKKVAVVEFPDLNGYQSALGQFIAEELITALALSAQPGQFDVVERRLLARVLREQELTASSLFDAESIARIGKILGIDVLVTGSLSDLGTVVKVNARAISVESAKLLAVGATTIAKTEAVLQLMKQNAGAPSGGVLPALASPSGSGVQRSDVFFQNAFLRVEVQSASKAKDGRQVTLALSLESITADDLLIAGRIRAYGAPAFMVVDDQGNSSYGCSYSGLVEVGPYIETEASSYTLLTGKSKTVMTLTCRFSEAVKGQILAFSGGFARLTGERQTLFSAGISNIQLGN